MTEYKHNQEYTAVCESGNRYKAIYNNDFKCFFFAIPSIEKIIEYIPIEHFTKSSQKGD